MAKRNSELRLFNNGVNADDSFPFLKEGELINALNVTAYSPYIQQEGSLTSLYAPEAVTAVNDILAADGGINTLLNCYADTKSYNLFLFFWNNQSYHKIIVLNMDGSAYVPLRDSSVVGGLGWTQGMYISIDTFGGLLIFTDNVNPIRYIQYSTVYGVNSLTQRTIAFGQDGFAAPLSPVRNIDTAVFTSTVQRGGFQFLYRIENENGFTSVLSPYSQTVAPQRQTDIDANFQSGNVVDCKLNFSVVIPSNWQRVDYIVRNLSDNTFFIFRSWFVNNTADVADVAAHNAGSVALLGTYMGVNKEAISADTIARYFQSIPIRSKFVDVKTNRLIAANNVLGYDTPEATPINITVTPNTLTADEPTGNLYTVYLILAKNFDVPETDFPIYGVLCISYGFETYILPESKFRMNGQYVLSMDTRVDFPYTLPQTVSLADLTVVPEVFKGTFAAGFPDRFAFLDTLTDAVNNGFNILDGVYCYNQELAKIVWFAHGIGDLVDTTGVVTTGDWRANTTASPTGYIGLSQFYLYDGLQRQVYVTAHPTEFADGGNRCFLPRANYSYGLKFMDDALRPAGDQTFGTLIVGDYNPTDRELTEKITIALTGALPVAPDWAKYFSFTISKNSICSDFLMFAPNCIRVARKDKDGITRINSDWSNDFKKEKLYALAVPLDSLGQYHKGYVYDPNREDIINLSFAGISSHPPSTYTTTYDYTGNIIGQLEGYVLVAPPSDEKLNDITGVLSAQIKQFVSPVYDAAIMAAKSNYLQLNGIVYNRQHPCYATIYIGQQKDIKNYEVALLGYCAVSGGSNRAAAFYNGTGTTTSIDIFGDTYTQRRESRIGGFTGLSTTTNETAQTLVWFDNCGRVSPEDRVGQQSLRNEVRWSNIGLQNTNVNNICNFDVADYRLMDVSAGAINMIYSNFGDGNLSNTLLVLCDASGFMIPLDQNVIKSTTGEFTITQSDRYIDNINELEGSPATLSPRSFASFKGNVFWVDVKKRCVYQYFNGRVTKISDNKVRRIFEQLLKKVDDTSQWNYVMGGINPLSMEYIISIPDNTPLTRPNLATTTIEYPFDFFYEKAWSWVYRFSEEAPKWSSIFQTGRRYFNLNNDIFSWDENANSGEGSLLAEYINSTENPENDGLVAFGFNSKYPIVKSPLSLTLDAKRAPDETWVYAITNTRIGAGSDINMVANVSDWIKREGQWQTSILRDRLGNGATSTPQWNASGVSSARLKGKDILVVMKWNKENGDFWATSCQLVYE